MKTKYISLICVLLMIAATAGCSSPKYGNSPDQQRKNAGEAQGELSNDIGRGSK